ncbi:MAG: hypothetical protein ACREDU_03350 [Methylocella sp.]
MIMIEQTDAPNPTPPATPATPPAAPPTSDAGPLDALKIASMLSEGRITTQQAGKLAAAGNIDTLHVAKAFSTLKNVAAEPPQAPDTRTDAQKQLDADFPPAKDSDFVIRYGLPDGEPMSQEMKTFDANSRAWLAGAEFPKTIGNSLVHSIDATLQHTQHMTDAQLESYGATEFAKLQRVYGDTLEAKLTQAGRMIAELDKAKPGLKQLLRSRGVGDNSMVASLIIQQSERYFARRQK